MKQYIQVRILFRHQNNENKKKEKTQEKSRDIIQILFSFI